MKLPSAANLLVPLGWRFRYVCLWTLTVLIAQLSCTYSAILTKPMNTVSVVGNKTKMECSRNLLHLPVDWEYPGRRETRNPTSRYKIDTDNITRFDLVIDYVDLSDAGTYTCIVGSTRASAELIVLESDPVCETDVRASKGVILEGDEIQMWCTIIYNGKWQPVTTHNRSANSATSGYSRSDKSTTISPTIRIRLTSSDNGVTITWKTSFEPPSSVIDATLRSGESLATNVPHYQHLWNYRANVLYGVRNLTIKPNHGIYEVGDRLTCSANGNPSPTFQWTEIGTNRVIDGSILTIEETMPLMQNLTFKCTATNTVAGESKEISDVATFIVTATLGGSLNTTSIALIVAGAIAAMVLLVLGLAKALTVKARGKGDSVNPRNPQEASQNLDAGYDMIDESKIQSGENIASEGHASLQHNSSDTFGQPASYDQQQLYLTPIDIDVEAT